MAVVEVEPPRSTALSPPSIFSPCQVRWNNKMLRITYSKSMALYLRRTDRDGWDLPPSTSYPDNRVCASEGRWMEELWGWRKFRGRHFKQPHYHYRLILFLHVSFSFTVYLADPTNLFRPIFYSLWMLRISKIRIVFVSLYHIHARAHIFILIETKTPFKSS